MPFIDDPDGLGGSGGRRSLDGGGENIGTGGREGGGVPGTVTGSSGGGGLPVNENGGVFGTTWYLFVPVQAVIGGLCYVGFYDIASHNDPVDGFHYAYRIEDVIPDQTPTVNRVILTYRDLGLAKLTFTLRASNDDGEVISATTEVQIGNAIPTGALLTRQVNISITGFRPQLTITRNANDGPACIVAITMKGECEEEQ